jgi:hypothetical protein
MLPDISNYKQTHLWILLFFAILTVDTTVLFLTRYFPHILGSSLNDWYDRFRLLAVLSDVLVILIGFIIAQFVYTIFLRPVFGTNLVLFLFVLVLVQAIHDILFYLFVIQPLPKGHNEMIDVFKEYAKGGSIIIGGDALLMLGSAGVALFYASQPDYVVASCSIVVSYALTYILYTKRQIPYTVRIG